MEETENKRKMFIMFTFKHKGLGPVHVWIHVHSRYHTCTHIHHTCTHIHKTCSCAQTTLSITHSFSQRLTFYLFPVLNYILYSFIQRYHTRMHTQNMFMYTNNFEYYMLSFSQRWSLSYFELHRMSIRPSNIATHVHIHTHAGVSWGLFHEDNILLPTPKHNLHFLHFYIFKKT